MDDSITVNLEGPLFGGRAPVITWAFISTLADDLGRVALENVQRNLDRSIRHPTPYYETQINVRKEGSNSFQSRIVNDRGVIYGPWLEGTGSRNATTRFKGYASFRRAAQDLKGKANQICARSSREWARKLGG